jgi:hypothetical protein
MVVKARNTERGSRVVLLKERREKVLERLFAQKTRQPHFNLCVLAKANGIGHSQLCVR